MPALFGACRCHPHMPMLRSRRCYRREIGLEEAPVKQIGAGKQICSRGTGRRRPGEQIGAGDWLWREKKEGKAGDDAGTENLRASRRRSRGADEMKLRALNGVSSAFHRLGTRAARFPPHETLFLSLLINRLPTQLIC
ncbi:unnamed protein product [Miscanthus lutarioriparius]|uniref:Uncharacterized protein n=1 Tax=Miscanthus lutarioriparius TaxID=422564 RepID=A0A811QEB6_9POAL|nr:unnamed protein product [Miscanthus lutarioriparius]